MGKLNEALDRSIREKKLSNQQVVDALGIYTAASIGNYRRGPRNVPSDLVEKWKEVFKEDLHNLTKTIVSTPNTNVSRETAYETDLRQAIIESLRGMNKLMDENAKLIDENSKLVDDKREEVKRLERQNIRDSSHIDVLLSKLGISKNA